jgi:hypothetical protein
MYLYSIQTKLVFHTNKPGKTDKAKFDNYTIEDLCGIFKKRKNSLAREKSVRQVRLCDQLQ